LVYGEVRRMEHKRMSLENTGASLQPTALVNKLYLRLADSTGLTFHNRSQFLAVASPMMRRTLVDAARTAALGKSIPYPCCDRSVPEESLPIGY